MNDTTRVKFIRLIKEHQFLQENRISSGSFESSIFYLKTQSQTQERYGGTGGKWNSEESDSFSDIFDLE